jgi:antitoxin (DNA-binding transcriptional repressor) of toxin-antitoxin stability system
MIVTKSGIPVAELRPVDRRTFVPAAEWARVVRALPTVDHDRLRTDIDHGVDQSPRDPFHPR